MKIYIISHGQDNLEWVQKINNISNDCSSFVRLMFFLCNEQFIFEEDIRLNVYIHGQ